MSEQSTKETRLQAFRKCCAREPTRVEIIEWVSSIAMAVVGLDVLFIPASVDGSHMRMLINTMPHFAIASLCIALGCLRLALAAQRQMSSGIFLARSILGLISAAVWTEMAFAFASRFYRQELPPGFFMMVIFQVVGDVWCVVRLRRQVLQLRSKGLLP